MSVIYGLSHDGEIRYVGKMTGAAVNRLRDHLKQARKGKKTWCSHWIRSVNYDVEPVVLERDPPGGLDAAERAWIACLRMYGCRLTNLTDGGEGGATRVGRTIHPVTRQKLSATQRARWATIPSTERSRLTAVGVEAARVANTGKSLSEDRKHHLSLVKRGASHTVEARLKMSISAKQRVLNSRRDKQGRFV